MESMSDTKIYADQAFEFGTLCPDRWAIMATNQLAEISDQFAVIGICPTIEEAWDTATILIKNHMVKKAGEQARERISTDFNLWKSFPDGLFLMNSRPAEMFLCYKTTDRYVAKSFWSAASILETPKYEILTRFVVARVPVNAVWGEVPQLVEPSVKLMRPNPAIYLPFVEELKNKFLQAQAHDEVSVLEVQEEVLDHSYGDVWMEQINDPLE